MSDVSVMSDMIDCPQCGLTAQKDSYYVVGEERVVCNYCGYSHIIADGKKDASKGYGSIHYVHVDENENGSNQKEEIIRLKTPLDLKSRHDAIMEIYHKYDSNRSSVFVWNEQLEQLECLHGSKPKTLEEQYQDAINEFEYYKSLDSSLPKSEYIDFKDV